MPVVRTCLALDVMIVMRFAVNLLLFLLTAVPAALVAAAIVRRSEEEWKLLAWVPVLPLVVWAITVAVAVTRDPTSHNLWPFELVVWLLVSAVLFAGVGVGRAVAARQRRSPISRIRRDRSKSD